VATLTYLKNGNIILYASITGCCFATPQSSILDIGVVVSPGDAYYVAGATTVYASAGYIYNLNGAGASSATNIVWKLPAGWTIMNGQGTTQITVWTGNTGGSVEVEFNDYCGGSVKRGKYMTVTIGQGGSIKPLGETPDKE
jgi:hypothetical protein